MSDRNDLPWDKRPLTSRDFAITVSIAVIAIVVGVGALFAFMREEPQRGETIVPTSVPTQPTAQAVVQDTAAAQRGKEIFQNKCLSCHTIGGGATVGPDLKGVVAARERDWLLQWIQVPDEMLAQGDPLATQLLAEWNNLAMPNLSVTSEEAADILAYIELESGDAPAAQPVEVPQTVEIQGEPRVGENLFVGTTMLENGGPACISCHSFSDLGDLGGGTLGPDLTNIAGRMGEQGLTAALQSLPFPSMKPIFDVKPLTEEEVAHLGALFSETGSSAPAGMDYTFVIFGMGGLVVLVLLSQLVWKNRLKGVRKPLVGR